MATIVVKRLNDPIFIENDRAIKLKTMWLDEKTPKTDLIDLGIWAGTFGDIKNIILDSDKPKKIEINYPPESPEQRERINAIGRATLEKLKANMKL